MLSKLIADISINCKDIGACPNKTENLGQAFANVTAAIMGVIGGLAVIFLIVSGIQMVASHGNAQKYERARLSLMYSVVGIIVAIAAYTVVAFIAGRLG